MRKERGMTGPAKNVDHQGSVTETANRKGEAEQALVQGTRTLNRVEPRTLARPELPPRQRAVAELVAAGLCDCEISATLGISENTVGAYLKVIFKKYRVHSRAALSTRLVAWSESGTKSLTDNTHERVYCLDNPDAVKPSAMTPNRLRKKASTSSLRKLR
jgi:DNA-binding CsgD family transcriptional regulator